MNELFHAANEPRDDCVRVATGALDTAKNGRRRHARPGRIYAGGNDLIDHSTQPRAGQLTPVYTRSPGQSIAAADTIGLDRGALAPFAKRTHGKQNRTSSIARS